MYYLAKKNSDGTLDTLKGLVQWVQSIDKEVSDHTILSVDLSNAFRAVTKSRIYTKNYILFETWKVLNVIKFRQVKASDLLGYKNHPENPIPKPEIILSPAPFGRPIMIVNIAGMEIEVRNDRWFYQWRLDRAVDKLIRRYYIKAKAEIAYY